MTATVVSLDSRRPHRPPACGCPRHLLEALTHRAVTKLAGTEGELFISREDVSHLVDDVVSTIDTALAVPTGRTNP